jgi:hypothetical protein
MRCYLTGSKTCSLKIRENPKQIFIAYNYKYKNVGKVIEQTVFPAIKRAGLKYKVARLEIRTKDFFCKICELIQGSKYFLANLTNPTFNVGLELGLALGLEKEVILIASGRTRIPSDLIRQEVIFYSKNMEDLQARLMSCIKDLRKWLSGKKNY